ncbi:hypothetical protein EDB81DRAFT_814401 [Dactylonectria macrodidyma]|uniref:Zn(2)-C6 fungal-type domain-containing protein n=1 Tax=Dactylonectria macrodidyma TaxID=307937 RepID=A0A9P9DH73_9HYPO|nr:hypothetical protein EDB81DRAFT_814401 [Dactylonectria macrodidyma]
MSSGSKGETIRARRQRLSLLPRACEGCKIRKTRCDRSIPCSNCTASGITCQPAAHVESENRPKVDRVAQLEDYVGALVERLAKVEHQLTTQTNELQAQRVAPGSHIDASQRGLVSRPATDSPGSLYEGGSSFTNLASEVAQQTAVSNTPGAPPNIEASFSDLHDLLQAKPGLPSSEDYRFSPVDESSCLPILEPLPVALVLSVLRRMKTQSPIFLSGYTVNDTSLIESLCQAIYFPTEPVSLGQLTSMNGMLYCLFKEYVTMQDPLCKQYDLKTYLAKCERNFNLGVETYDVLAVPSFHNVLALTLAVIKAQSECKPQLCCTLISAAASHCQMLGYHREMTYRSDNGKTAEQKRRIFWSLYVFDKNMSLLLGRASSMQDSEIDAEYPSLSKDPSQIPWDQWFVMAILLAKEQGRIYQTQYSAAALKTPVTTRDLHINELHMSLQKWRADLDQIDASRVKHPHIFALSRHHWDIMYYSTLTSLLRASTTSGIGAEISFPCFDTARLSLQSHLRCFSGYQTTEMLSDTDFANWVLHNSSFSPFLVIFLHAIAATSVEDVQLLDEVVETLRKVRGASSSSERLYLICATFARIAGRMVEEQSSCVGMYDEQTDSLQLLDAMDQIPIDWQESLQDFPEMEAVNQMFDWDVPDMAGILTSWAEGQPSVSGMFGTNSRGGQ